MNGNQIFQFVCLGIVLASFPFTIHWLRQAGRYNRITTKIRTGQPLTPREQRLLDKAKS